MNHNEELQGVYFLSPALRAAIVAINQLPATQETLWLRILGRGATQAQAIRELIALPREHPFRMNALELLLNWRLTFQGREVPRFIGGDAGTLNAREPEKA